MYSAADRRGGAVSVAVVVPCYRVRRHIRGVVAAMPEVVDHIIIVDDACPEKTGAFARQACADQRLIVLERGKNGGVGAAVVTGYRHALQLGADIVVKVDGDGQMDPGLLPAFLAPIQAGLADYTKGNRFFSPDSLRGMPMGRLLGNAALSFLSKLSTGYWRTFDPTNGYTALHTSVLKLLPLDKLETRYFFESEVLFRLGTVGAAVIDIPMRARYANEDSNMNVGRVVGEFAWKHLRNIGKRFCYNYLLRDFSVATLEVICGILLLGLGLASGVSSLLQSHATGVPTAPGTVAVAVIGVILGLQLVLSFIAFDIARTPSTAIHPTVSSAL